MFELNDLSFKLEEMCSEKSINASESDRRFFQNEISEMWLKVDDTILWTYMIVRTNSQSINIESIERQSTNLMCHLFYMHHKLNALFTAVLQKKSLKDLMRLHNSCLVGWNRCVHFKEAMYDVLPIHQWADAVISPSKPFTIWNFISKNPTGSYHDVAFNLNAKLFK